MAERRDVSISIPLLLTIAIPVISAVWFMADMNATQREQGKSIAALDTRQVSDIHRAVLYDLALQEDLDVICTYIQRLQVDLAERGYTLPEMPQLKAKKVMGTAIDDKKKKE